MTDFSHLEKLDVAGEKTATYTLYQLAGEPTLLVSSATESNKPYFNALLRKSRRNVRAVQAKNINAGTISENRDEDRALYAEHIVKGWEGVKDSKNNTVEFNKENLKDFLEALPNWLFDEVRNFASRPENFIEDVIETEDIAKN